MHIELTKRGREPDHYFSVTAKASEDSKKVHVGYVMRPRPTDDEWFATVRYKTGPVIIRGKSPEGLLRKIEKHIIESLGG